MANLNAPILYQEARLSAEPTSPSSVLTISTTKSSLIPFAGRKRTHDEISGLDEDNYAGRHLATEASVFFRRKASTPRSFLWRVLDERKEIEVQCVDLLSGKRETADSLLTFRLQFQIAIVPHGVAFADSEEHDALEVFVLTESHELFTFTLKRDLLVQKSPPKDFDASTCYKTYKPSVFSLSGRRPYRLISANSLELYISLSNGQVMCLQRRPSENGSQWRELFYNDGSWGQSVRSLVRFGARQTIRHQDTDLDPSTAAAVAKSPDGRYVWTVCLDHTLKAWSTKTGRPDMHIDLLGGNVREPQKQAQYHMSAEQGMLMQILSWPEDQRSGEVMRIDGDRNEGYVIVVHSPTDHQFKLYCMRFDNTHGLQCQDLLEGHELKAPIPELMGIINVWQLEEFFVKAGPGWSGNEIWIRARSGALCRTYMLTFDLYGDSIDLEVWKTGWVAVGCGLLSAERMNDLPNDSGRLDTILLENGPLTSTERWLSFLFYPNRFSAACVETALNIYRKGRGLATNALGRSDSPLQERISSAVSSKILMRRLPGDQPDYERYQQDLQAQWEAFYGVVRHLHARRCVSVGLAFDEGEGLAWALSADFVAPVRACSVIERLKENAECITNPDSEPSVALFHSDEDVFAMQVLRAIETFRLSFSPAFHPLFKKAAVDDEIRDGDSDSMERLQALYEQCNFAAEIADEDFDSLTANMEIAGGLGSLSNHQILGILECTDYERKGPDSRHFLTLQGDKLAIRVAQETLQRTQSLLLDLLVLVVFMAADLETSELSSDFDAGELYGTLTARLKQHELLLWLASHVRQESSGRYQHSNVESHLTLTLLESLFIGDFQMPCPNGMSEAELLTFWPCRWIYAPALHRDWEGVTAYIFADLLKHSNFDLATEFLRFLPDAPAWTSYLKGRLYLITGDYSSASFAFQGAAEDLSSPLTDVTNIDTANLLKSEERMYFGGGRQIYYQHVLFLFEKLEAYSYVADFASLALHHLSVDYGYDETSIAELDKRKNSMYGSLAADQVDLAMEEIRVLKQQEASEGILARLFSALVQTGRHKEAYEALAKLQNPTIRKANLQALLQAIVTHEAVSTLLALPFSEELAADADAILLSLARGTLADMTLAHNTPYVEVLYAFRMQRQDSRGAAEMLFERLQHVKHTSAAKDPEHDLLTHAYLLLINTLVCCGEDEGWILPEPVAGLEGGKRKLVTLADIRNEYSKELDRRSNLLQGRFGLIGGGEPIDVL